MSPPMSPLNVPPPMSPLNVPPPECPPRGAGGSLPPSHPGPNAPPPSCAAAAAAATSPGPGTGPASAGSFNTPRGRTGPRDVTPSPANEHPGGPAGCDPPPRTPGAATPSP
ncbi:4-O-methyl-glucuronoyl methylesterase 1-like [Chiroxiphia lanceolata]|uniref:4-O-methyl-glucuronoyl methylesterase 1-like n=1 Tax=Chiroxiphia lanceolata TaxID=296741 RepID=UPI0013CEB75C|nr:4-O-methyl-glucuronoyl methylesterase 1-like [Chiroxiphia lanceolata]